MPEVVYRSKSWHEFNADSGKNIDFVMTVCGNAASFTTLPALKSGGAATFFLN
ncbi:MAG TPA: hypothetical protein PLW69_05135 [Agitococcus sp.]|nr:hypothetical protein [Agitococcus sp.]